MASELEPNGLVLYRNLVSKAVQPADLGKDERRAIVAVLDSPYGQKFAGNLTQEEMAQFLDASPRTIRRDLRAVRRHRGHLVTEQTLEDILGDLKRAAGVAQYQALNQGDAGLFWKIEQEFVASLRRLGIVASAPIAVEGSIHHHHAFQNFDADTVKKLLEIDRDSGGREPPDRD